MVLVLKHAHYFSPEPSKTPGQQAPLGAVLKAEVLIRREGGTGGGHVRELSMGYGADKTKCYICP